MTIFKRLGIILWGTPPSHSLRTKGVALEGLGGPKHSRRQAVLGSLHEFFMSWEHHGLTGDWE